MDTHTKEDIKIVLDYLWADEEKHYRCAPSKKHIFLVLRRLARDVRRRVHPTAA